MLVTLLAAVTFAIWLYLSAGRGGFWLAAERDAGGPVPASWPAVVAVIPARDEAEGVAECIASLLGQDYPGPFSIILVDDLSTDDTAEIAKRAAAAAGLPDRLTVLAGKPLPAGWTGKLWAMKQGIDEADKRAPGYLLLTDADIAYAPNTLTRLVARAEKDGLVLNSLMAKLR
jgi:glycosyltransferase involved in cell wall biosynthesis